MNFMGVALNWSPDDESYRTAGSVKLLGALVWIRVWPDARASGWGTKAMNASCKVLSDSAGDEVEFDVEADTFDELETAMISAITSERDVLTALIDHINAAVEKRKIS